MAFNEMPPGAMAIPTANGVQLGGVNSVHNSHFTLDIQAAWIGRRYCVSPDLALTLAQLAFAATGGASS